MYPLKLQSVLKDIIWGGTLLSEKFGKGTEGQKIAEAWVLANRPDGKCIVENGEFSGKTLDEVLSESSKPFPLLIKLIDACDNLSVQVHPDDSYAHSHGLDAGKTEMWYILEAKPGAKLVYGMNKCMEFSADDIRSAAKDGTLDKYLNYVPVKKGDVFFIPAGLVHAIGGGILIAEVQQNSNTTYRLYDYGRRDKDGNQRELHIEEALNVIDKTLPHSDNTPKIFFEKDGVSHKVLCDCDFFSVEQISLCTDYSVSADKMIHILCTEGDGKFAVDGVDYSLTMGDSYLITEKCSIDFSSQGCEIILSYAK